MQRNYVLIIFFLFLLISIIAFPGISLATNDCVTQKPNHISNILINKTILITGFGPFHIYETNPSEIIAEDLNRSIISNSNIISWVLPIDFKKAPALVKTLIETYNPNLIIMLGLAPNATSIRLETLAINLQFDPYVPNPLLHLTRIDKQGPFFLPSTLNVLEPYNVLKEQQIPVDISFSAGWYLCNTVFYETNLYLSKEQIAIPSGFIHVPQFKQDNANGLEKDIMIEAITSIIHAQTC